MSAAGGQRSSPPVRPGAAARPAGGLLEASPVHGAKIKPVSVLDLERDGAVRRFGAARSLLSTLDHVAAMQPQDRAGTRLHGIADLSAALTTGPVHAMAAHLLNAAAHPVRAILFDKSPSANWSLGWHQDRTIAVRERRAVPGFGPWTVKQGILHVAPPFEIIEAMVTLRIHLDDVPADNAPLLIAPGSHRLGFVAEPAIDAAVARCGTFACLAERGDVWAYATPILHASTSASGERRRRVLQVDYAAGDLPGDLAWLGI